MGFRIGLKEWVSYERCGRGKGTCGGGGFVGLKAMGACELKMVCIFACIFLVCVIV